MNFLRLIRLAFAIPSARTVSASVKRDRMRRIVAAHSHGNIRLQAGRYYTKRDVDAKFDQYRNVHFSAES